MLHTYLLSYRDPKNQCEGSDWIDYLHSHYVGCYVTAWYSLYYVTIVKKIDVNDFQPLPLMI